MPQAQTSEFRVQGVSDSGKPIQGIVQATSIADARKKAKTLATANRMKVLSVLERRMFIYRARKGGRVIDGEQMAFSREDVRNGLQKIGFTVVYVRRKWFSLRLTSRIPAMELVSFLNASAKLLEEKLPLNEVLQVLTTNIKNEVLKSSLREIIKDLKDGADSRTAFVRQEKVFGKNVALMLGIATKSNDIPAIFRNVSQFVERETEFKKGLRSALILPAVTTVALAGAMLFYVSYILPQMVKVYAMAGSKVPTLTRTTMSISEFLDSNMWFILVGISILLFAFYKFIRSPGGRVVYDRLIMRVPYFGTIIRNTSIELFCRVLGIMYSSAGENIDTIGLASEACRNTYVEKRVKTIAIPQMVQFGSELPAALEATKVFPDIALSRFRAGAETGGVRSAAVQLAEFYELENRHSLKNLIEVIQLFISFIIMVAMVFLTFLSTETATISINRYF